MILIYDSIVHIRNYSNLGLNAYKLNIVRLRVCTKESVNEDKVLLYRIAVGTKCIILGMIYDYWSCF